LTDIDSMSWPNWALRPKGIYYLRFGKFPRVSIDFLDFSSGKKSSIWTLENYSGWGLSVSNDGKSIVYVQNEFSESDLMLVKNFQ
jgi:hypothetical protein